MWNARCRCPRVAVAWRERDRQPLPAPPVPKSKPTPCNLHVPLCMKGQAAAIGIIEPEPWEHDECVRRAPVLDEDRDYSVWAGTAV